MKIQEHRARIRVHFALKATIASGICACLSILLHLPLGFFSPVIAAMVIVVFEDRIVRASVLGYPALVVAGLISALITRFLADSTIAYLVAMLGLLLVWMAFLTPLPLGRLLGAILISLTLLSAALGTMSPLDLVTDFLTQALLGIVVPVAVDRLLWPPRTDTVLNETLAELLRDFAHDLDMLASTLRDGPPSATGLRAELSHIAFLSKHLSPGPGQYGEAELELNLRCRLNWDRLQAIQRFTRGRDFATLEAAEVSKFGAILNGLARHDRQLADAVLERRPAPGLGEDVRLNVAEFAAAAEDARSENSRVTERHIALAAITLFTKRAESDHDKFQAAYNAVLARRVEANGDGTTAAAAPTPFTWPTTNVWKVAAKTMIIMFILLIGVTYFDFPGSSLVGFYGVVFGMTANMGQLLMKTRAGISGVVCGLLYGIVAVFLVNQCPHFLVLLGFFSLGIFVSSYLASGSGATSFMGLQAALLIPFVFLIYEGPVWTLDNAVTRAWALAVSAAVAFLVQPLLWPVDPLRAFRSAAASALAEIHREWALIREFAVGARADAAAVEEKADRALVLRFGESASLLEDCRYVVGSDHRLANAYLRMLESVESAFAEIRLLRRLLAMHGSKPVVRSALAELADPLENIAATIEVLVNTMRWKTIPAAVVDVLPRLRSVAGDCARVRDAAFADSSASLEERSLALILLAQVEDVATTLALMADAAVEGSDHGRRGASTVDLASAPSTAVTR